jgi:hypothetical protein
MNVGHLVLFWFIGGVKGGDIDALLVGILTKFEPVFGLFEGTVAAVDGDFMIWVGGGVMKVEAGLSTTFTKAVPICPKLSVIFSWNRRSVSAVTLGAINSHTGVFTPLKLLGTLVGICIQEYDRIIPLGALLFDPLRITADPAVTTWPGPALAMGGSCKDWWLMLKLEVVDTADEGFFKEDDGDAKTNGVEPLLCCSCLVVLLTAANVILTPKVFVNWARAGLL